MYHVGISGPYIFTVMFLIGIIAESMTGVISSSRRNMDAFGVVAIALTTALGGGVVRDLILGNLPVTIILHPYYIVICLFFSIIAIFTQKYINKFYKIFLILDSIGLIAFAYIGSSIAHQICTEVFNMQFFSVFIVGVVIAILNGVAGGIMRDMICNDIPVAFTAELYASVAAVVGGMNIIFIYLNVNLYISAAIIIGFGLTIRIMSIIYKWKLPII
ncbi:MULTISPECIES: trimeric intracellular cation channel family protein [Francisella]|uniref:Trimeric intracellular cation channel family protein n=2 Tax=Francisella TaxID=262 RepID=A0ABX5ZF10_9GAMM|nr:MULTISPECIES: trimeric intracellular cation channel family protein [Francisella]AEI36595.1 membrane protein [Francisella salina]QEO56622.1 trimeric intracellular cation channel family protein [Francisella marina]QEO59258.1 trimeric intracellular cation channel family protein [Francisella marina]